MSLDLTNKRLDLTHAKLNSTHKRLDLDHVRSDLTNMWPTKTHLWLCEFIKDGWQRSQEWSKLFILSLLWMVQQYQSFLFSFLVMAVIQNGWQQGQDED